MSRSPRRARTVFRLPWRTARSIRADVDEELRFHIEMRANELRRAGLSPDDALHEAMRQFGDLEDARQYCGAVDQRTERARRHGEIMGNSSQDVAYAFRRMARAPGFTMLAAITLALGIGANTAVFSVVNGILLRPLPFTAPEHLVSVWPHHFASGGEIELLQENARSYEGGVAAVSPGWGMALTLPNEATQLDGARSSTNLFHVLGVQPLLGRTFREGESRKGAAPVAILSAELWRSRFGSDARIIGQSIVLDGHATTVIGVLPPNVEILRTHAQLWMPLEIDAASPFYKGGVSLLVSRLARGVTPPAALAELRALIPSIRQTMGYEAAYGNDAGILSLQDAEVGSLRATMYVLMGAVAFLVLIAGANVGNLLLARTASRSQELAVRSAIGASRARIVRQLLIESTMLAAVGGLGGLVLGTSGVAALKRILPPDIPRLESVTVDVRVLAVCALLTILVGLLCGVAPAMLANSRDLQSVLRAGARSSTSPGSRLRRSLVVLEVALALVLIIGAGLMSRTLWQLAHLDPGFRDGNVLTMRVQPSGAAYASVAQRTRYYDEVLQRLRGRSEVSLVGAAQHLPLSGFDWHNDIEIEGRPLAAGDTPLRPGWRTIGGDYLRAMHIPLRAGREFAPSDVLGAPPVALVSEAFAREIFPGESALGKRFRALASREHWVTIVGVVGSVRHSSLTEAPRPEFYLPITQSVPFSMAVVIRTRGEPARSARALYEVVASVDRGVPISELRTLRDLTATRVAEPRAVLLLMLAFALVGLALGAVGIYGVVSYSVSQRLREIGIRVALGAGHRSVVAMVVREGLGLTVIGVAIGLLAAVLLAGAMRSLLFGVSAIDPPTYLLLSVFLISVAIVASYLPARRAARVDPLIAMRTE